MPEPVPPENEPPLNEQPRDAGAHRDAKSIPRLPAFGSAFWFAYLANTALMLSVSLLFRYGDFVAVIGGDELDLGWIVGVGTIGCLAMRLVQGMGVDRYGPRQVWLFSLAIVAAMLLAHLAITTADSPAVYLVRTVYHMGLAGAFGASITYISLRAPRGRMAEMIGILGSSGFVGMALGTQLGDWLCAGREMDREIINRLFVAAAGLTCCSFAFVALATRGQIRPPRWRRPPLIGLLRRYHPGNLLLMASVAGIGVGLPGVFLRPYTASIGITQLGTFFGVYSITAFVARLMTRHVPDRLGVRPTVLLGMGCLVVSMLLYLPVQAAWQLILPALAAGVGHALLFPAIVAGGSRAFPDRHRGVGTALTLGAFDIGHLVGMPLVGNLLHAAGTAGMPAYPTMFIGMACLLTFVSAYFALAPSRRLAYAAGGVRETEATPADPEFVETAA